jgi:hypothetical protein
MSVCPSVSPHEKNSITAGRIWMKFGMDVMPLGYNLKSYFQFPTIVNTNMVDERTDEVGSTLAPLTIE